MATEPNETDLTSALASLPHGPEFRFIDQLESLTPGLEAVGLYRLREQASFLSGHFPGHPIMPGVLMIEALAQVAGVAAQTDPTITTLAELKLTAVRQVKILGTIAPGNILRIHARISGRLDNLVLATGMITSADGTCLLDGQVTLSGRISTTKPVVQT
jgi:3-hydroxyacyl-[acyl-carrier-protein] dehydratase